VSCDWFNTHTCQSLTPTGSVILKNYAHLLSRDSVDGTAVLILGFEFCEEQEFLLLFKPSSLLFNGYKGCFPRGRGRGVILTSHLYLAPGLWMSGAIPLLTPTTWFSGVGRDGFSFHPHTFTFPVVTNFTTVASLTKVTAVNWLLWLRQDARRVPFCGRSISCLYSPFYWAILFEDRQT
jgi:hypothetical protein